jgi:S1-C subfamily serine protease
VPISIGDSETTKVGDLAMIIPAGGESDAKAVKIGKIKKYSGGWEYIVDKALHTYPPSTHFSGAALVSDSAELLGIGGLVTIDIDIDPKVRVPGNIFVPVNSLMSVIGQLLVEGRSDGSKRPWIGLDTKKTKRGVAVSSLEKDAPAKNAGLRNGDIIVAVAKQQVKNQIDFYEKIWKAAAPGDTIDILVLRGDEYQSISVDTVDYYDWLHQPSKNTQLSELTE